MSEKTCETCKYFRKNELARVWGYCENKRLRKLIQCKIWLHAISKDFGCVLHEDQDEERRGRDEN